MTPKTGLRRAFKRVWPWTDRVELEVWTEMRSLLRNAWLYADRAWRARRDEVGRWNELYRPDAPAPPASVRESGTFGTVTGSTPRQAA